MVMKVSVSQLRSVLVLTIFSSTMFSCSDSTPAGSGGSAQTAIQLELSPEEAMAASAERLGQLESVSAKFDWKVERTGHLGRGHGTYKRQSDANLQIEEHYDGNGTVPFVFRE